MKNKFKAKKIVIDGITFDSKGESDYYRFLKQMEELGRLQLLELQPKVYLTEARILYKPDFLIQENNELVYIDYKGFQTPVFNIKKRLWKFYGPAKLRIVKKSRSVFEVVDEIPI